MKLTKTSVQDLFPKEKAYEVSDVELKGFFIRIQPTGLKTFYFHYRNAAGKKHRIKLGRFPSEVTVAQAREKAMSFATDVNRGIDPQEEKKAVKQHSKRLADSTLGKFLEGHYDEWAQNNLKTGGDLVIRLRRTFEEFLNIPLSEITPIKVERWRTARLSDGRKPSAVNRRINDLRGLLRRAKDWGFVEENPLKEFKSLKVDKIGKVRYLSDDERARLMEALDQRETDKIEERERFIKFCEERKRIPPPTLKGSFFIDRLKPMVLISLKTGMRKGELFDLLWSDVDFTAEVITVRGEVAKSGKTRQIPMHPDVLKILKEWREQNKSNAAKRVFPSDDGGRLTHVKSSWGRLLKEAQIENFRWHDMRHDFASQLVMRGVPLNTIREFMGHGDMETTLRYAHLAPDHKKEAIKLL